MDTKYPHLDLEYMPKGIRAMMDYFQDAGEYNFLPELLESTLFFNTSCAMQLKNIRVHRKTNKGVKTMIPCYMGIILGNAGCGKDYSLSLTSEPYRDMFDKFSERAEAFTISRNNRDEKNELLKQFIKISNIYQTVTSTTQALQKTAQTLDQMQFGSVNVFTSELGDEMGKMSEVFTKLKMAYDEGVSEGQLTISDSGVNYFTVKDIAYNSMLMGSPTKFILKPSLKDDLMSHYVSGVARRFFIFYDDTFRKSENRNRHFESMEQEEIDTIHGYFKEIRSHINNVEHITFPKESRDYLIDWDIDKEILRENSESLISDDIGSPRKIERLAAIIAVLDLEDTISIEHIKYAIAYSERVDKTAEESVKIKPMFEQIYDELSKRGFISRTELIKNIKHLTTRELDNEIILTMEYANELGNSIIQKEYSNIIKYKLEKLTATQLNGIIISTNENPSPAEPTGWKKKQGKFENLHTLVCSASRYTFGSFLNGHICKKNYMSEQNIIAFDSDEDMTLDDAKNLFRDVKYLIATTRNHQKEKNGSISDRFRVILPTSSKFHLGAEEYSKMYKHLLEAMGLSTMDQKVSDASRWYFGNPGGEYWYNDNDEAVLLDIRPFIDHSAEANSGESNVNTYISKVNLSGDATQEERRLDGAFRWFLQRTSQGNRSDMIFRFGAMIATKYETMNVESTMRKFNSILSDPLKESELNSIIKSVGRLG